MSNIIKKGIDRYNAPTPTIWKNVGNTLLLIGSTVTGISAYTLPPYIIVIASVITCMGKIITDFATNK